MRFAHLTSSSCGGLAASGRPYCISAPLAEDDIFGGIRHFRSIPKIKPPGGAGSRFWTAYSVPPTFLISTTGLSPLDMPK
jgi:hypothetical protein